MPENPPAKLRIYCICGQKMRVSSNMLGRPGKCVACRQKIRIPRLEELPGDGSGYYEFYLKDHPELLRKPAAAKSIEKATREEEEEERGDDQEDLALGEPAETAEYIPLDILEPLRILCSFEYAVERRLEALRQAGRHADVLDKPTLLGHRALVRNARSALDDQLRHRLHETVEQLSGVTEQIARAVLGFRIGEMDFAAFQSTALALRERRERLERRRANLRGWLAVSDPYLAGGYTEVQLEQIPGDGGQVTFPLEPKPAGALMDHFIERLREALKTREHAERKLSERKRMEHEGGLSGAALEDCRADAIAERERAWAAVSFYRARLEQLVQDCESDIKAARAHLEVARGRLDTGEIDLSTFQESEMTLLRAQADYSKARDFARRALAADRGAAVPRATGTFLKRIGRADKGTAIGIDSWIAWFASTLIILNTLTPMSKTQISSNVAIAQGMVIGFFVTAVLLAAFACIPRRDLRGALITGHWLIAALMGAYHIQRTWHSMSAMGMEMRSDPAWFSGPGIMLFLAWMVVIGIAALVALAPYPRLRYLPVATGAIIAFVIAGTFTDFSGALLPRPTLDVPEIAISESDPSQYEVSIAIGNDGIFRRSLWLGGKRHQTPYPALLVLERRIGSDSWEDAGLPVRMRRDQQPVWSDVHHWQAVPLMPLGGGGRITLQYRLQPGVYRTQLILEPWSEERLRREFTLSPPPQDSVMNEIPAPPEEMPPQPDPMLEPFQGEDELSAEPAILAPLPMGVRVELRGLINAADFTPRFSVFVYAPDGTVTQKRVSLGDEIYSPWHATEYNPALKTLTVSDGSRMLAIQPGEVLYLEVGP